MVITRTSALSQPLLKAAEEQRLIAEYKETGNPVALDRITKAYYRLCYSTASNYTDNEAHLEDLAQEASFGIARAILKYDASYGVKFSTYIRGWLQTHVSSAAARTMSEVSIPARKFIDAKMNRLKDGGNSDARNAVAPTVSLDATISGEDGGESVGTRLVETGPDPEQITIMFSLKKEITRQIGYALQSLNDRERRIIVRRRLSDHPETLEEIAHDFNVTRERVRQIEHQALGKMRAALECAGFDKDLF